MPRGLHPGLFTFKPIRAFAAFRYPGCSLFNHAGIHSIYSVDHLNMYACLGKIGKVSGFFST